MVVIAGALPRHGREGTAELPRGYAVAQQHSCHGVSHTHPQLPRLQNSRNVFRLPLQSQRPAIHQYRHHRLSSCHRGPQQFLLGSCQTDVRPGCGLSVRVGEAVPPSPPPSSCPAVSPPVASVVSRKNYLYQYHLCRTCRHVRQGGTSPLRS